MPQYRIFVGRLPLSVTTDEITARFAKFGKIVDAYIPFNPVTRQSKGMAFVSFDNEESVQAALAHGKHMLGGELCEAKRADPKSDTQSAPIHHIQHAPPPSFRPPPNIPPQTDWRAFVKGVSDSLSDDSIRRHFETFGAVNDVYLPLQYGTGEARLRKGIGYITFAQEQSLLDCIAQPQQELEGITLTVSRADNNRA
eukprot:CAMPEP_0113711342 /NCGR_PEP_ID=MMETSP0038_2-20120614/30699_1 /TAXON_ID=2898 /ORGANISM="Cryptomonas paramecium" /LENGTH=196 /DNA_ID=CAMNT_0000637579 /DNA_START=94 /DNA_END=681 /DNA_ORIENTATION=+ /assembly_acc=CAM_ASM_000170